MDLQGYRGPVGLVRSPSECLPPLPAVELDQADSLGISCWVANSQERDRHWHSVLVTTL